jgi:MFS family permease
MKLWSAETVSQFGTQISLLAFPITAVLILHANALELGILGTVQFLPFILVGLPAGVWVDRMRRRPILIAGDVGRAVALASIPIAYELDALTLGQLYVVAFLTGVLTVFFDVAYQSFLPTLVGREHLVEGNGKLEISRSAAQIGGPGIGGQLIDVLTAPVAIALDALSFVGSAVLVLFIRRREEAPERHAPDGTRPRMRADIAVGLRYVWGHPYLRSIAACTATANLFGNMAQVVLILFALDVLGLRPGEIGLVFSVASVSALLGAFLSTRLPRWVGVGPTIVGSAVIFSLPGLLLPLATKSTAIPLLMGWGLLGAFANVVYNVNQVSLRQAITPERLQGRMNATMRFMVWGTIPIGSMVGGLLGEAIGLRPTLWIAAVGGLVAILPVALTRVRSLRTIPEPEPEPEEPIPTMLGGTLPG